MAPPQTFHPFPKLPTEIKFMIFQLYRDIQPSVRHYLQKSEYMTDDGPVPIRHYAAIYVANHIFDLRNQGFADTSSDTEKDPPQSQTGPARPHCVKTARLIRGTRSPFSSRISTDDDDDDEEDEDYFPQQARRKQRVAATASAGSASLVSRDLAQLEMTNEPGDWRKRVWGDWFVRIDVIRDVVYLADHDGQWLAPFAYGQSGSVPFRKVPRWFTQVRKLALRLPWYDPSSSRLRTSYDRLGWRAVQNLKTKWRLPDLELVYLVGLRASQCPLGPPCSWPGFRPDELDEHNFLPSAHFLLRHGEESARTGIGGSLGSVPCHCQLSSNELIGVQDIVSEALGLWTRSGQINVRIVADPY